MKMLKTITFATLIGGALLLCPASQGAQLGNVRGVRSTFLIVTVLPQALLSVPSWVSISNEMHTSVNNLVSDGNEDIRISQYPANRSSQEPSTNESGKWVVESVLP